MLDVGDKNKLTRYGCLEMFFFLEFQFPINKKYTVIDIRLINILLI